MKSILKISLLACTILLTAPVIMPISHEAEAFQEQRMPLMVIRFNQRSVAYRKALFGALAEAVRVKPSVVFEVVGYAPAGSGMEKARMYSARVADDILQMGVKPAQVQVTTAARNNIKYPEVRIFVR